LIALRAMVAGKARSYHRGNDLNIDKLTMTETIIATKAINFSMEVEKSRIPKAIACC
jgi:hypothetical protein